MSFQRKNQVLSGSRVPRAPARGAPISAGASSLSGIPRRGPGIAGVAKTVPEQAPASKKSCAAVKPSILTSDVPVASSGSSDLDKLLLHNGIPLGTSLLVEETGTTNYSSVLLKYCASLGVHQHRIDKNSHVVVIGDNWVAELPGEYAGTKKEVKKQQVAANENKVSVQNMLDKNLKIAWRYGLKDGQENKDEDASDNSGYIMRFDISKRITTRPSELTCVDIAHNVVKQVEQIVAKETMKGTNSCVLRIVAPSILSLGTYSPEYFDPSVILQFLHGIETLVKKYNENLVFVGSMATEVLDDAIVELVRRKFDSVVQLDPFSYALTKYLEKSYKNQPNKVQQGFVNVIKVAKVSDRGAMVVKKNEHAFKLGKRSFEIGDWSIPVDNDEVEENIEF